MANAVIYARYSSSHQREESIEGQIRECTAFAHRQGLNIINIYADRAVSGRTEQRPEFQRMIEDAGKKTFSFIIIYTFDRFFRDRGLSAIYKHKLKKYGVRVLSAKENIDNSPAGVLMESVLEGFSEYYSLELAQKVKRGMTDNVLKGKWAGSPVPFGFALSEEKKLIKHPINNEYLRKICEMYLNGAKYIDLQRYLNEHAVRQNNGKPFNKDSFKRILACTLNYGFYKWDEYEFPDYIEPTITRDMYEAIITRMNTSKRKGVVNVRKSEQYLLTPHFHCAECGGMMQGSSGANSAGVKYYYYVCANQRNKKTDCSIEPLHRDTLEDAIFNYACLILNNPANLEEIAEQAMQANKVDIDYELQSLVEREKEVAKLVDNFMKAIEKGIISDTLVERFNASEAELIDLRNKIAYRKTLSPSQIIEKKHIMFFLKHIASQCDAMAKKQVIRALVRDVAVQKQKNSNDDYIITVRFNYSDTPNLSATQEFVANVIENSQIANMVTHFRDFNNIQFYKDGWQVSFRLNRRKRYNRSRTA